MDNNHQTGIAGWRSPSNIALVKYWGKYGNQLPKNPSISFTLSQAFTETIVRYESLGYEQETPQVDFYFEGKPNEAFKMRIEDFLSKNIGEFSDIKKLHLSIESRNSFPHSSGIASSASSMSALALCLCSIENQLADKESSKEDFLKRASHISRLASGSACRSVYPKVAAWGASPTVPNSDNQFAVSLPDVNAVFDNYHDDILIVSKEEKSVSSSVGHSLMDGNVYAESRYQQAEDHTQQIYKALQNGDLTTLGKIVEDEALTLHALMMCSDPSFILMKPNTLEMISRIRHFRKSSELPVYFTLDAGPNIHLLYPDSCKDDIEQFINQELISLCEDGRIIKDQVGSGPIEINSFSL